MERRTFRFYTKRSEHYNTLQKQEEEQSNELIIKNQINSQPLKDYSNIQYIRNSLTSEGNNNIIETDSNKNNNFTLKCQVLNTTNNDEQKFSKSITNSINKLSDSRQITSTSQPERPLKCLETLAQKAGITFDEKYEVASTLLTLEKSQSPAQVAAPSAVPLQISPEQLQQLQQFQLQQAFTTTAIQVKQEFPNQNQMTNATELKPQMVDHSQNQIQQMQVIEGSPASPHHTPNSTAMANSQAPHSTTTISTMSPLQALPTGQVPGDWSHGRVQVLQPSLSNQGYLQHLYPQVLMSGNLLHSGLGQQPIQVIAAGKPFQGGQLTPQMLTATAQSKPMLGGTTGSFSGAYTLPSNQSQTLLFSPVSVISSQPQQQQQNILPTMTAQSNNKNQSQQDVQKNLQGQKVLQKVGGGGPGNGQNMNTGASASPQSTQQCVQVSQAMPTAQIISPLQQAGSQPMQFTAPWLQSVPQFWTNGIQSQTLLAPNPIIIRGTQADGSQGMFIPQATTHQAIQAQPHSQTLTLPCTVPQNSTKPKPQMETLAPKQQARAPPILPQSGPPLRPASSVSTQTAQNQTILNQKQNKLRNKQQAVRPALSNIKTDASNQTKIGLSQAQPTQTMHQVVTSAGNKMVVMSTGTPINIQGGTLTQQMHNPTDKQQIQIQQMKQQHQHQQQVMIQQQQQQLFMQQASNQQLIQQQIAQQLQLQQQQNQQQQQQQQQISHNQSSIQQSAQQTQFITQQQQQQQIQNQLIQQQQQQQQQQHQQQQHQHQQQQQQHHQQIQPQQQQVQQQQVQQQQHQQQQQQTNGIIHQIVVQQQQQSPQLPTLAMATNPTTTQSIQHITLQGKSQVNLPQHIERHSVSLAPNQTTTTTTTTTTSAAPVTQSAQTISNQQNLTGQLSSSPSGTVPAENAILPNNNISPAPLSTSNSVNATTQSKLNDIKSESNTSQSFRPLETSDNLSTGHAKDIAVSAVQPLTEANNNDVEMNTTESKVSETVEMDTTPASTETDSKAIKPEDNRIDSDCLKPANTNEDTSIKLSGTHSTSMPKSSTGTTSKTEKDLPKAMIKPNVLTHVIEGFVIQEASEPFAVTRQRYSEKENLNEPPKKRVALDQSSTTSGIPNDTIACGHCGKQEQKSRLKKKRFCSLSCARTSKNSSIEQNSDSTLNPLDDSISKSTENHNSIMQSDKNQTQDAPPKNNNNNNNNNSNNSSNNNKNNSDECPLMVQWTVSDVCEFIKNLPGCTDYADDFAMQEIDGQALLLLKENHLVNAMGMKLGPALKIVAKVESMKEGNSLDKEAQ